MLNLLFDTISRLNSALPEKQWLGMMLGLFAAETWAGPPLATDDPGVLDPGAWELILAMDVEDRSSGRTTVAPVLDASLGLTPHTQISFVLTREKRQPIGEPELSGPGVVSIGYKWRFYSGNDWEWAVAPAYEIPASHDVIERGGPDDVHSLALPILGSKTFGSWTFLGQVAWNLDSRGDRSWDFGAAAMHPLSDRLTALAEITSSSTASFGDHDMGYRIGFDFNVADGWHLLGSFGSRLNDGPDPDDRLDRAYYLAIQWMH